MKLLQAIQNAVLFITILPVGRWREDVPWEHTLSMFPVVGLVIGALLWTEARLVPSIAPVLCLISWVGVTGAFHLDGLADTFDALASGKGKAQRLSIMKEPHIGTYGVVAVVLVLITKFWCIQNAKAGALVIAPVMGRFSLLMVPWLSTPAKEHGLGHLVKTNLTKKAMLTAGVTTAVVSLACGPKGLAALATTILLDICIASMAEKKFGGITGDTLGCACELTETVVMALFALWG